MAHPAPSLCEYMASLAGQSNWDFDATVTAFFASRQSWEDHFAGVLVAAGIAEGDVQGIMARANRALVQPPAWRLYDDVPLALTWMSERRVPVGIISDWPVDVGEVLDAAGIGNGVSWMQRTGALSDAIYLVSGRLDVRADEMIYVGADHASDVDDARILGCHALLMDRPGEFDETVPNVNHLIEIELHI